MWGWQSAVKEHHDTAVESQRCRNAHDHLHSNWALQTYANDAGHHHQVVWQSSVPSIADFSDPTHPNYLTPSGTGCGTNVGIKAVVYKDPKDPSSPAIFGSANVNVQCATGSGLDFGLSAAPTSVTVSAVSTATYTINVVVNSGSPTVDLQFVGGLPSAGSTASLNPSSVTGTAFSTLTISTAPGTAPGTYHPKITGTDGSGALTLVLTLIVN